VDEAKVRLNLAVAPMAWLMPAQMVINTASTIGYNNKLKQAVSGMKLGVNNEVNPETKKAALKLMAGGPSKINQPNSHPSNPIHKAATAESKKASSTESQKAQPTVQKTEPEVATPQHEINKTAVIIGAVGVVFLFMALR
jgi:Tfp pilus assembly protein FimV